MPTKYIDIYKKIEKILLKLYNMDNIEKKIVSNAENAANYLNSAPLLVCMYIHISVYLYIYICICINIYKYVCTHICIYKYQC
jgi:hypothetical protein